MANSLSVTVSIGEETSGISSFISRVKLVFREISDLKTPAWPGLSRTSLNVKARDAFTMSNYNTHLAPLSCQPAQPAAPTALGTLRRQSLWYSFNVLSCTPLVKFLGSSLYCTQVRNA